MVCVGGTCTFNNVSFKQCGLVVISGAHTVLQEPVLVREGKDSISVFVHGAGTNTSVNGGSMTGGMQGVSVQAGAQLEATDLSA